MWLCWGLWEAWDQECEGSIADGVGERLEVECVNVPGLIVVCGGAACLGQVGPVAFKDTAAVLCHALVLILHSLHPHQPYTEVRDGRRVACLASGLLDAFGPLWLPLHDLD